MRDKRADDVTRRVEDSLTAKRLAVSYLDEVVSGCGIGRRGHSSRPEPLPQWRRHA